jgi:hypothetical protein
MIDRLLQPSTIRALGWVLFFATPVAAAAALYARPDLRRAWLPFIVALALLGPAIVGAWFVFNAIENAMGLDSLAALLLNLLLFSALGAAVGFALRRSLARRKSHANH